MGNLCYIMKMAFQKLKMPKGYFQGRQGEAAREFYLSRHFPVRFSADLSFGFGRSWACHFLAFEMGP